MEGGGTAQVTQGSEPSATAAPPTAVVAPAQRPRLRQRLSRLAAPLLVFGLLVLSFALGDRPSANTDALHSLSSGWSYAWTDRADLRPLGLAASEMTPIVLPAHPSREDEVLWLARELPPNEVHDASVAFDAILGPCEAYLGAERVFSYPAQGIESRGPPGLPWQVISLPPGHAGKLLRIRILADYTPAGVKGVPLYGSRSDLLEWTFRRDVPRLVVGLCVLLIALFALVGLGGSTEWRLRVSFALYVGTLGLYIINYTHLKDILLDAPLVWFVIWVVALPLNPIAGLAFASKLLGTGKRGWLHRLFYFHVGYAALLALVDVCAWLLVSHASAPWHSVGVTLFSWGMNGLRAALLVSVCVLLVVLAKESGAGDRDARIYLFGMASVFAFALRDVVAAFGAADLAWKSQVHIGVLVLTLSLMLILQRRQVAVHERAAALASELAQRAQEKEFMLRDLHDGIGTLTSNVRMLAEVGSRRTERAQAALDSIVELSGVALAELRGFVSASEARYATWEELTAELRSYGAQVVQGQSREFTMHTQLSAPSAPSGLICLQVTRIFREAITNASKQLGGSYVHVTLSVAIDQLSLTVENDGAAPGRALGINAGRGVANLTARARELGGELKFEAGQISRLTLSLPLTHKPPASAVAVDPGAN